MDARDLRNLSKAYQEVHQIDEISADLALRASKRAGEVAGQLASLGGSKEKVMKKREQQQRLYSKQAEKRKKKVTSATPIKSNVPDYLPRMEEFDGDIFDYLLEYLVAEGYADTNEAAIAIMANMSEEWRDDILEERKPMPWERIEKKTQEIHDKFKKLVKGKNPGDLAKAYRLTDRVGKMYQATKPTFDKEEDSL
jgi:hypothetical protein